LALELAVEKRLVLICGHYEGIDARVHERLVTHEISIGDYVLSGGELPAMVLVDAVVRHLPGALGSPDSAGDESFTDGLLEAPPYTRRRSSAAGTCPTYCCRATIKRSRAGVGAATSSGRPSAA